MITAYCIQAKPACMYMPEAQYSMNGVLRKYDNGLLFLHIKLLVRHFYFFKCVKRQFNRNK